MEKRGSISNVARESSVVEIAMGNQRSRIPVKIVELPSAWWSSLSQLDERLLLT